MPNTVRVNEVNNRILQSKEPYVEISERLNKI